MLHKWRIPIRRSFKSYILSRSSFTCIFFISIDMWHWVYIYFPPKHSSQNTNSTEWEVRSISCSYFLWATLDTFLCLIHEFTVGIHIHGCRTCRYYVMLYEELEHSWIAVSVGFLELIPNRHWRMMVFASLSCHLSLLCANNSAWKIVGDQ